jgi:uncharacterized ubiquitin-like protein YukD
MFNINCFLDLKRKRKIQMSVDYSRLLSANSELAFCTGFLSELAKFTIVTPFEEFEGSIKTEPATENTRPKAENIPHGCIRVSIKQYHFPGVSSLVIKEDASVQSLIEKVKDAVKVNPKLLYNGRVLSKDRNLKDYGIKDGALIRVMKNTEERKPVNKLSPFWTLLETKLSKHLSDNETRVVMSELRSEYSQLIKTMTPEDLQRLIKHD